jgi:dihydropteroate synthase
MKRRPRGRTHLVGRRRFLLHLPGRQLELGRRTLIMGVVNVTPDSFSDGGRYLDPDRAAAHALALERAGADVIDIGAESTRPGAQPVSVAVELERLLPVLQRLRGRLRVPISVDTQKSEVAARALAAGAELINDVSGLRADADMAAVVRRHNAGLILMHMRGTPRTMQQGPFARAVLRDVRGGLETAVARALAAGIERRRIILDPGLGFGKTAFQNYRLLARLPELAELGFPLLVGPSRKTFLTRATGPVAPCDRDWATAAAVTAAVLHGAHMVRVHDVARMVPVVRVADLIRESYEKEREPRRSS